MAETSHLTLRAHPDLLAAVERRADVEDTTVSDVVRRAVVEYLDAAGEGRPKAHPARRDREAAGRV